MGANCRRAVARRHATGACPTRAARGLRASGTGAAQGRQSARDPIVKLPEFLQNRRPTARPPHHDEGTSLRADHTARLVAGARTEAEPH